MISFCAHCWAEIDAREPLCPRCEVDLTGDTRSYEEKLIGALAHPLPEARARVCWLIGENRVCEAVPSLIHLAEHDPDLFVRKGALEALGAFDEPASVTVLRAVSRTPNRLLARTAWRSLRRIAPSEAG